MKSSPCACTSVPEVWIRHLESGWEVNRCVRESESYRHVVAPVQAFVACGLSGTKAARGCGR